VSVSAAVDVIIVGAGAAGCVLASRLSEDRDRTVMLLEAGPDYPTVEASPPDIVSGLQIALSHDWGFSAERADGRSFAIPRACLVGGSSATNATFALRGLPADYDAWAASGLRGWSFGDVLPYFRRLETDRDFDGDAHGHDGPIPIRRYPANERTPVQEAFLAAAEALGHPRAVDHNAPSAFGAGPIPMNTEKGVRRSAALTYLFQARGRPNLEVRAAAPVAHVLFEGSRAVGVQLADERLFGGHVILAAGAIGSPMILMRSGIGPAQHLAEMGIAVRVDLPGVGEHLADHPLWSLRYATTRPQAPLPVPAFQTLLTLRTPCSAPGAPFDAQIFPTSAAP
jgi:choline dehydrogenase